MDSALPLRHVGSVVARALVPIAGVLFLHWSASNLLIVYFADTLASLFSVGVLAAGRLSGVEKASGPEWYRRLSRGLQLAGSGALIALVIGLVPFGFLLFMLLLQDFFWRMALYDRDLWIGVAAQFCAAVTLLLREYGRIEADPDADRLIRARFGLIFMRWFVVIGVFMLGAEVVLPFGDVGAWLFGFVLVLTYALATIAMELQPWWLLTQFGAGDLVPGGAKPAPHDASAAGDRRRR